MEGEMDDFSVECLDELQEFDWEYEYDAAFFYDFSIPESPFQAAQAQRWFETAGNYPPSRKTYKHRWIFFMVEYFACKLSRLYSCISFRRWWVFFLKKENVLIWNKKKKKMCMSRSILCGYLSWRKVNLLWSCVMQNQKLLDDNAHMGHFRLIVKMFLKNDLLRKHNKLQLCVELCKLSHLHQKLKLLKRELFFKFTIYRKQTLYPNKGRW